jgi:hypothetical protein
MSRNAALWSAAGLSLLLTLILGAVLLRPALNEAATEPNGVITLTRDATSVSDDAWADAYVGEDDEAWDDDDDDAVGHDDRYEHEEEHEELGDD